MQQTASLIVTRAPQSTQELFSRVAHWTLTIPWGCDPKEELALGRGRCSHHVPRLDLRKGLSITPQTKEFACHLSTTSPISYGVLQVDSNPADYSLHEVWRGAYVCKRVKQGTDTTTIPTAGSLLKTWNCESREIA